MPGNRTVPMRSWVSSRKHVPAAVSADLFQLRQDLTLPCGSSGSGSVDLKSREKLRTPGSEEAQHFREPLQVFFSLAHPPLLGFVGGLTDLQPCTSGCLRPGPPLYVLTCTACFLPCQSLTSREQVFHVFPSVFQRLLLLSLCTPLCIWLIPCCCSSKPAFC